MKKIECPLCGDYLQLNRYGIMRNDETGEQVNIFFCEECEQSFILKNWKPFLIPFRHDMTPIKHECVICGNIEQFDQSVCFVFNGTAIYDTYCIDCSIEFYRNWMRTQDPSKVNTITKDNIHQIEEMHEIIELNKALEKKKDDAKTGTH